MYKKFIFLIIYRSLWNQVYLDKWSWKLTHGYSKQNCLILSCCYPQPLIGSNSIKLLLLISGESRKWNELLSKLSQSDIFFISLLIWSSKKKQKNNPKRNISNEQSLLFPLTLLLDRFRIIILLHKCCHCYY